MKTGANLYKHPDRAEIYDKYILTKIERRNFGEVARRVNEERDNVKGIFRMLDLCCGTAVLYRKWLFRLKGSTYVGVDRDSEFLKFADRECRKIAFENSFSFIEADATKVRVTFPAKEFDVVVGTSAYHHMPGEIEHGNGKKLFAENMFRHTKAGGAAIIYEKMIGAFQSTQEAILSGMDFYCQRIKDILKEQMPTSEQLYALFNEMYLTAIRVEEFKVGKKEIIRDMGMVGYCLEKEIKLWPEKDIFGNADVGDFVFLFRK